MLWLLAQGQTAHQVAGSTGYSAYWIGQIARRYNQQGPVGVADRRHHPPGPSGPGRLLSDEQQAALRTALHGPAPAGGAWTGPTVAAWMSETLGRRVGRALGWVYLRRLGLRRYRPRPRHVQSADAAAQAAFKGGSAS